MNSITFKWKIKNIQLLIEKIEELKKTNPELLKDCTIIFDVVWYTVIL